MNHVTSPAPPTQPDSRRKKKTVLGIVLAVLFACLLCPEIAAVAIMRPIVAGAGHGRMVELDYPQYGLRFSVPYDWTKNDVFVTESSGIYIKVSPEFNENGTNVDGVVILHFADETLNKSLAGNADAVLSLERLPVAFNHVILEPPMAFKLDGYQAARRALVFPFDFDYVYYFGTYATTGTMIQATILHEGDVVEFGGTSTAQHWAEMRSLFLQILKSIRFTG